jgi:hypothetical protein
MDLSDNQLNGTVAEAKRIDYAWPAARIEMIWFQQLLQVLFHIHSADSPN